jgi:AraC-like DNA-binding protein
MSFLYVGSGTLILFFILLLYSKREKNIADKILIVWFVLLLSVIGTIYVSYHETEGWNWLIEFAESSTFLYGPILWWYTRALTRSEFRFQSGDLLHLIPSLISAVFLYYFLLSGQGDADITGRFRMGLMFAKMTILFIYSVLSLQILRQHSRMIFNIFSDTERKELNWLKVLILGVLGIWGIAAVSLLLFMVWEIPIAQYGGFFTNTAISVFIIVLGYFGFRQTTIFTPKHLLPASMESEDELVVLSVNQGNSIDPDSAVHERSYQQLLSYFDSEQPYLDGNLTLYKLAQQVSMSPSFLSRIINRYAEKNFFDFINDYRVREVKRQLQQGADLRSTLLGLALDAGFNSKTAFNRAFKKSTGMTPSEYKRDIVQIKN